LDTYIKHQHPFHQQFFPPPPPHTILSTLKYVYTRHSPSFVGAVGVVREVGTQG
jgi:hypothetical protein